MPNYCDYIATFKHQDPETLRRAMDAFNREALLREFLPCPSDIDGFEREDWCTEHWGTKWDVRVDGWSAGRYECGILEEGPDWFRCAFLTAWGPPFEAYDALQQLGFEIEATDVVVDGMDWSGTYKNGVSNEQHGIADEILTLFGYVRTESGGYAPPLSE